MKTNKSVAKTKKLIAIAIYQLMHTQEYDEITVKDICEKAGVSRMSFYRYYSKKDDVFIDFCDERFEEFYSSYLLNPNITIREFCVKIFLFFKKYYRQLQILKKADKTQLLMDQFNNYARYLINNLKFGSFRFEKNNPVMAPFFAGGLFNVLMVWLDKEMSIDPEEITDKMIAIFEEMKNIANF